MIRDDLEMPNGRVGERTSRKFKAYSSLVFRNPLRKLTVGALGGFNCLEDANFPKVAVDERGVFNCLVKA